MLSYIQLQVYIQLFTFADTNSSQPWPPLCHSSTLTSFLPFNFLRVNAQNRCIDLILSVLLLDHNAKNKAPEKSTLLAARTPIYRHAYNALYETRELISYSVRDQSPIFSIY